MCGVEVRETVAVYVSNHSWIGLVATQTTDSNGRLRLHLTHYSHRLKGAYFEPCSIYSNRK